MVGAGAAAGAGAACTTNVADALMDDVLAVMVRFPVDAAGMVMPVLKAPVDVVWNAKVVEPTITVPVVAALKPVPVTVTAEPAGPDAGLSVICGVVAALAGWTMDKASPAPIMSATNKVLSVRNTAIYPQIEKAAMAADDVNAKKHWHRSYGPKTAVPSRKPQFFPSLLRGCGNGPNLKQNKIPRLNTLFSGPQIQQKGVS